MKIIIDTDVCKKEKQDADIIVYLSSLLAGCPITQETFEKARKKNFLTFHQLYNKNNPFPDTVTLSQTGEFVTESVIAASNSSRSKERFNKLADKLRALFPAGTKPGYAYTWRDSTSCISDRLEKFVMKYGDHPDEEIIDATKRYVDSFNGNYQYMQLLKYFIWKNKVTGEEVVRGRIVGEVERQSQLAAYLEDTEDKNTPNDWDVKLC